MDVLESPLNQAALAADLCHPVVGYRRSQEGTELAELQVPQAIARHMSSRSIRRQRLAALDVSGMRILEIGALDNPTFSQNEANVSYLDWFSAGELRAKHRDNPRRNAKRIVDVTYVMNNKRFAEAIADRFDLVIANHVVEHVPDVITWLQQVSLVTTDHGIVFLSIPDRRYTFDYLRRESDVADLLRAYRLDLERPDFAQLLAAFYYHRPIRGPSLSNDDLDRLIRKKRFTLAEAIRRAEKACQTYTDVHCHVFSSVSFEGLFADLRESQLIGWRVADITDVAAGSNEFHAILTKESAGPGQRVTPHPDGTEPTVRPQLERNVVAPPKGLFATIVRRTWPRLRPLVPPSLRRWLFARGRDRYYRLFPERRR